jgi:hypothetical protein
MLRSLLHKSKAEIIDLQSGTKTDENNKSIIQFCALMTLIGGVQMLTVIFSMNFQWPQAITHAFKSAIGPIVFFNFVGAYSRLYTYI